MSDTNAQPTTTSSNAIKSSSLWKVIRDIPFIFWMIGITLALAFFTGLSAQETISRFNTGFGSALGEFALILLPAFTMAAALGMFNQSGSPHAINAMIGLAPISGAGMVCPDTAYAALSPAAQNNTRNKLSIAFGAYAGFKLLFPAGPLLVATTLGAQNDPSLVWLGFGIALPVWLVGLLWVRAISLPNDIAPNPNANNVSDSKANWTKTIGPFAVLLGLVAIGLITDFSALPIVDFITQPKGALIVAALFTLGQLPASEWRPCLEQASRRTAVLLLMIGAASAFGAILTSQLDISAFAQSATGPNLIFYLFALTMLFKLIQGSSLATFAAIAPVTAPIISAAQISPIIATFAICLGSFIAILPNDSFYWLVRRDALTKVTSERHAIFVLSGGAVLQALTGLFLLWLISQWI
ncbi:hypothetical protein [Maritalea sp. S77]|uniref:GntT/GntP/DsdX family permease n=1 Tax=Maritalea sp. S77 TaxID=3415125 RepID=UPI003C79D02D